MFYSVVFFPPVFVPPWSITSFPSSFGSMTCSFSLLTFRGLLFFFFFQYSMGGHVFSCSIPRVLLPPLKYSTPSKVCGFCPYLVHCFTSQLFMLFSSLLLPSTPTPCYSPLLMTHPTHLSIAPLPLMSQSRF